MRKLRPVKQCLQKTDKATPHRDLSMDHGICESWHVRFLFLNHT